MLMSIVKVTLIILIGCSSGRAFEDNPIVRIKNGFILGRYGFTEDSNIPYTAFQGIPYAEPPVGQLRFEAPVPKRRWRGILNTTKDGAQCPQNFGEIVGSEDCLFINVYTPQLASKRLPVMVWIYGGAFQYGSSSFEDFGPDYLLEHDVVIVTFNYRLGILGFLSTGDLASPGNNGLKDQVLALHWVKKNIHSFGGDPNQVTIFGQSAGSASVSYHLQSPLSRGLFQRSIMESGVSLCLWGLHRNSGEMAKKIAKNLNINSTTTKSLVQELKKTDYKKLLETSSTLMILNMVQNPRGGSIIGPVIEPDHDEAFISFKSHELMENGDFYKVPIIIGYNSLESNLNFGDINIMAIFKTYLIQYDLSPSKLTPFDMNVESLDKVSTVGNIIKSYYFHGIPIPFADFKVKKFISDDQFVRPIQEFAILANKHVPVYFYQFSYKDEADGDGGVAHGEEQKYIWKQESLSEYGKKVKARMVTLWTNFAKFGHPTPRKNIILENVIWTSLGENLTILDIGNDLTLKYSPQKYDMELWSRLYDKYGQTPYDTF